MIDWTCAYEYCLTAQYTQHVKYVFTYLIISSKNSHLSRKHINIILILIFYYPIKIMISDNVFIKISLNHSYFLKTPKTKLLINYHVQWSTALFFLCYQHDENACAALRVPSMVWKIALPRDSKQYADNTADSQTNCQHEIHQKIISYIDMN